MLRGEDAKRHSLLREVSKLGSEAAKRNSHCEAKSFKGIIEIFENTLSQSHSIKKIAKFFVIREFVKFLSLLTKRKLFALAPEGRESSRLNAVNYGYERGGNKEKLKHTDRATECAMTNVGEDNNILSPKNLLKRFQEDLSLNAQDDERVTVGWAYQPNNVTNYVQISEIWMNVVPSPKFLSSP